MKKGQQEMIGFAFVVVLVVIIGLFFLVLSIKKPTTSDEIENTKVNNLLNSISYYTTSCEKNNLQQVIIACGKGEELTCGEGGPCKFAEEEIKNILSSSFSGDYTFLATKEEANIIEIREGECPGERNALSAATVLPGRINIKLLSCPFYED